MRINSVNKKVYDLFSKFKYDILISYLYYGNWTFNIIVPIHYKR